jgi:hypothetical protein
MDPRDRGRRFGCPVDYLAFCGIRRGDVVADADDRHARSGTFPLPLEAAVAQELSQ